MIILKTPDEIAIMAQASRIVAETLILLKQAVRAGVTTDELDRIAEEAIRAKGATPAFKGYRGYPKTLCASVNEQVVHGVPGERRLAGLFTSAAYHAMTVDVPLLRGRVAEILGRSGIDRDSHDGKALQSILDSYPRDELFQIDVATLYDHVLGILQLQERRRVALFVRRDPVERFATCLVFVPRERFDATLSERIAGLLAAAWQGEVTSTAVTAGKESALAQVLYTLKLAAPGTPTPDLADLERQLTEAATSWSDRLRHSLQNRLGEVAGRETARHWRNWFPSAYRETYPAARAVEDLDLLQAASRGAPFGIRLTREPGQPPHRFDIRLFHPEEAIALSDILPPTENLGLRVLNEVPFRLSDGATGKPVALQVLTVEAADGSPVDLDRTAPLLTATAEWLWAGAIENDGFNRLVLAAGLTARQVEVVRAYSRYLRQIGFPLGQQYIEAATVRHATITAQLVALFETRFRPDLDGDRQQRTSAAKAGDAVGPSDSCKRNMIFGSRAEPSRTTISVSMVATRATSAPSASTRRRTKSA